jgi:hypothetical protein
MPGFHPKERIKRVEIGVPEENSSVNYRKTI